MNAFHLSITACLSVSLVVLSAYGLRFFLLLAKNTADRQARRLRRLLAASWSGLVVIELHGVMYDVFTALGFAQTFIHWSTQLNLVWDLFLLLENIVNLLLLREFQRGGLDCLVGVFHRVDELKREATLDSLTGLLNRASLAKINDDLPWQYASILMIDIDDFKRCNDTHGHQFGDYVLGLVGQTIRGAVREADLVFRYGGEEFLVICPEAPLDSGLAVGERVCHAVADLPVPATVSIGAAFCAGPKRFEAALEEADEALYAAKAQGKNRVASVQGDSRPGA